LTGIIVTLLIAVVGGYFGINTLNSGGGEPQSGDNTSLQQECSQSDAIKKLDCRNVLSSTPSRRSGPTSCRRASANVQAGEDRLLRQRVSTGCGVADSGTGPFYCPADDRVYIDLTFYRLLADQLGAPANSPSRTCSPTSTATTCRTCSAPRRRCAASSNATRTRRTSCR
jgi:predicted metalloprotease